VGSIASEEVAAPLCVVRRTLAMNDLEQRLRLAMVAYVGGSRPAVPVGQVQAALESVGVPADAVSIHSYASEDFLVVFAAVELRNRVATLPSLNHGGFSLFFRKWTRLAQATRVAMHKRVHMVIEGVPPHAWDMEVIKDLLGKGCAVEDVAPETRSREDLSLFKLTAWTSDLDSISVAKTWLSQSQRCGKTTRLRRRESFRISLEAHRRGAAFRRWHRCSTRF
jgi:hypothetical protein